MVLIKIKKQVIIARFVIRIVFERVFAGKNQKIKQPFLYIRKKRRNNK